MFLLNLLLRKVTTSLLYRSMASLSTASTELIPSAISISLPWGGNIAGKAWGNPKGHPVLALHGWLDNSGSFDKLIPLLSRDLYVVAIDLPGHGHSSHRPPGCHYHFLDYIVDLNTVISELKWDNFSLLCHSMGAGIGTWFAASRPDLIKCAIYIEAFGIMTRPADDLPKLMGKSLSTPLVQPDSKIYPTWDGIIQRIKDGYSKDPHMTLEAVETLAIRGARKVDGGYQFNRDLRVKQPSILYACDAVNDSFVKAVSFPTLVIFAEGSIYRNIQVISKKLSLTQRDLVKAVEVAGGHHVHLCSPQTIAPAVNEFLLNSVVHADFKQI